MANTDRPNGAIPVRHLDGSPYNGQVNEYVHLASDGTGIFIGDFVKLTGTFGADADGEQLPVVAQAAAGNAVVGVCVGVKPVTSASTTYCEASTLRTIYVADNPSLIFEIQEDSDGGALVAGDAGENADIIVAAGSTTTGRSGMEIDSSTSAAAAATLRLHRLVKRPDNELGNQARWEVIIGEHQLMQATAQIGTGI